MWGRRGSFDPTNEHNTSLSQPCIKLHSEAADLKLSQYTSSIMSFFSNQAGQVDSSLVGSYEASPVRFMIYGRGAGYFVQSKTGKD